MITRPLIWVRKLIVASALLTLAAFAMPVFAGKPATVKVKVELEAGIGGTTGVTYKLYRVQAGCCDECRKSQKPCRKCGCPIAAAVDSVTLQTSGLVEFKAVPAGTYLIENEIGGKSAGYEAVFKVRENETMNLGSFTVDSGKPWLINDDLNDQVAAADNSRFRTAAKASDDIAQGVSAMINVKRKLAQQGKISAAEESLITDLLLKVNTADKFFVAQIKALRDAPDAAEKATLARVFAQVTSALNELDNKGLLPLGNADAKSQLAKILSIATSAAQMIEAFLEP